MRSSVSSYNGGTIVPLSKRFVLGYLWLLLAAALMVVYRGLTQSVTIDEAYAYHLFLNQKAAVLFQKYDAAYHVLHTWACWLFVHKFGKSEAILRLPSMLGGLFYLAGMGVLCRRIAGSGWRFLIGVVLLSANPLLADYFSAARGYGAALAFFVWAFDALLSHRPVRAGVLLGLSVACNLTFLVPATAAGVVYLAWQAYSGEALLPLLRRLALPFFAVAVPILAIPLSHAQKSDFYYGASELKTSLNTMIESSMAYGYPIAPRWIVTTTRAGLAVLAVAMILAAILAVRQRAFPAVMATGTLIVSSLALIGGHLLLGMLYPWTRTGIYLIWLFLASCLTLWEWSARQRKPWRLPVSIVFGAASILFAIVFVGEFDTRYYYDFRDDANVSTIMRRIREIDSGRPACIGGSWRFEPTVNYYRLRYRLNWIDEMKRTDEPRSGCRFFILSSEDRKFADRLGLRPLLSDPISGATLAEASK